MSIIPKPMDRVAMAVGEGCIRWNDIEFMLHELCVNLARFHHRSFDNPNALHVIDVTILAMDARQRIVAAKALAADGLDPDLYSDVEKLLSHIDGTLRSERNRFVHDGWIELESKIVRSQWGPRVSRPQSRQLEVSYVKQQHYDTVEEVEGFATRMTAALDRIIALNSELEELSLSIWPLGESETQFREE